jgi:thioesterase domain-containing protein
LKPLFCFGGKGGTPIRFNRLFEYLRQDQPVYYFRSRGLMAGERTENFVEDIAADYIKELKKIQPHGPYYFLGESGGGLVAYEMAQQLQHKGEAVAFLGMLDTYISRFRHGNKLGLMSWLLLLRKHIQSLTGGGRMGLRVYAQYYLNLWKHKFLRFKEWARKKWMNIRYGNVFDKYDRVERANKMAGRAYMPKPYSGTVHLFHAARQAELENNSPHNGWGEMGIEDLVIHPLECFHGNILFEPFVGQLAEIVNRCLDDQAGNTEARSV